MTASTATNGVTRKLLASFTRSGSDSMSPPSSTQNTGNTFWMIYYTQYKENDWRFSYLLWQALFPKFYSPQTQTQSQPSPTKFKPKKGLGLRPKSLGQPTDPMISLGMKVYPQKSSESKKAFRPCQKFCMTHRKILRCVTTFFMGIFWDNVTFSAQGAPRKSQGTYFYVK